MNSAQKAFHEMCKRSPFIRDANFRITAPFCFWWDGVQWRVAPEQAQYVLARLVLEGNSNDRTSNSAQHHVRHP